VNRFFYTMDNSMTKRTFSYLSIFSMAVAAGSAAGLLLGSLAHATPAPTSAKVYGDPAHGKVLYQTCEACHAIEDNDVGPKHRGVVGRRAGSVKDYVYSAALKASGITWDETTLDAWLSNPSALVPGTKMFFKLDDPQARADIIAYLKEQK
jgi:cytochrome c